MKEKYLFSVDLDATLLNSSQEISERTKEYVHHLIDHGHHFILNTGRPFQGAKRFLNRLDIHEPIIVNNGTAIVYLDDEYDNVTKYIKFNIETNLLKSFINKVKPYLNNALLSSIYHMFTMNFKALPFWVVHEDKNVKFIEGDLTSIIDEEVMKCEFYVNSQYNEEFKKILTSSPFNEELEFIYWGTFDNNSVYEVSKKGVNKGYAMKYLASLYNIDFKNTMSFGDQLNDLPMINSAYYGVSMINGQDEVKKMTHYITTYDNDNDGVIMFIKEYIKE